MKKVLIFILLILTLWSCTRLSDDPKNVDLGKFIEGKKIEDIATVSKKATGYASVYGSVRMPNGDLAPYLVSTKLNKSAGVEWREGEYVVYYEGNGLRNLLEKYKDSVSLEKDISFDSNKNVTKEITFKEGISVLKVKGEVDINKLRKIEGIKYIEPNYIYKALAIPNDAYYSYQWHYDKIKLPQAWDKIKSANVIVAVVDTGVSFTHPDLKDVLIQGYDYVDNDTDPTDPAQDVSHGTHVAGTIAAMTNNSVGVSGVNWGGYGIKVMPVRVLGADGTGSLDTVAAGVRYAVDHGAKIINMSLGGGANSQILHDAIKYAYNNGVTVICAAGNENGPVSYPAKYTETIAVASVRYDLQRAPYSNYGPEVDIAAPGGDTSVDQNGDGYADGVLSTTWTPNNGDTYMFLQGTSMAAPHVAGVAALVYANGVTSPSEIRNVLISTAVDLGTSGKDDYYGYGLIDAYAALNYTGGNPNPDPNPDPNPTIKTQVFALSYDYYQNTYVLSSEIAYVNNGSYTLNSVVPYKTTYICAWRDNNNNGTIDTGDYFGYNGTYYLYPNKTYGPIDISLNIEN
ncbi:S8 family peptidase [Marinitoga sp. 38H-ov]|uniref:S8 family peptidase n=1 Tax=Marinitoga sp. 38H-ov TaxID=1755814 RepID=UPI0013EDB464|nr:S8 family peptidase [Marinitoga sp. 38H-ov]KAF2955547.1 peptidase S8 [Marinitoga sp. 38H-ov]